jgi:hypothetical protein
MFWAQRTSPINVADRPDGRKNEDNSPLAEPAVTHRMSRSVARFTGHYSRPWTCITQSGARQALRRVGRCQRRQEPFDAPFLLASPHGQVPCSELRRWQPAPDRMERTCRAIPRCAHPAMGALPWIPAGLKFTAVLSGSRTRQSSAN